MHVIILRYRGLVPVLIVVLPYHTHLLLTGLFQANIGQFMVEPTTCVQLKLSSAWTSARRFLLCDPSFFHAPSENSARSGRVLGCFSYRWVEYNFCSVTCIGRNIYNISQGADGNKSFINHFKRKC